MRRFFNLALAALFVVAALSVSAGDPPKGGGDAAKSPQAGHMKAHHEKIVAGAKHTADMKAECEAMMARKQEAHARIEAMDARLDKLVAEMNAAKESREADAMEKPMAAVLNELVVQRKALYSMMMEMQPAMMAHMLRHMHMHGTKGALECPLMIHATGIMGSFLGPGTGGSPGCIPESTCPDTRTVASAGRCATV